jgi:hypothetical protein
MKGVKRFGVKGKLSPHYIGPFPILEKRGNVAYKLELSPHRHWQEFTTSSTYLS